MISTTVLGLCVVVTLLCLFQSLLQRKKFSKLEFKKLKPLPQLPLFDAGIKCIRDRFDLAKLFTYLGTLNVPVVSFKFFTLRFAVINDLNLAKECLQKNVFSGVPSSCTWLFHSQGQYGLLNTYGKRWEEQRKFFLRHLKNFGFKENFMESLIQRELDEILELLQKSNGQRITPNKLFYIPIVNSLWMLLTGERFSRNNLYMKELILGLFDGVAKAAKMPECLLLYLPLELKTINWLSTWFPLSPGMGRLRDCVLELRDYFRKMICQRNQSNQCIKEECEDPKDFLDVYLQEIQKTDDENSIFFGNNGVMNLMGTMVEFFVAGGDTTATVLAWVMLHLVRNPGVQRKIQIEIDSVVGKDRRPNLRDRIKCPYTEAFLWEVLRFTPPAICCFPHETIEDTNIGSYFIPKGTQVLLNILNIHHCKEIWGDPEIFRPERFLSPDEKTLVKNDGMCAFSIGKRKCPGEQVARDNLFLFVSSICQKFELKKDAQLNTNMDIQTQRKYSGGFQVAKTFYVVPNER